MPAAATERHHRFRLPWAMLLALLLVAGFDVALRISRWPKLIPYEMGLDEYYAVAAQLDLYDPAEVVFVGSSRTRESIHLDTLKPILAKQMGREVTVASYALSRARLFDFEAITRRVLREPRKPRVIVRGVSERDLVRGIPDAFDMGPTFWRLREWRDWWSRSGTMALDALPVVIRNETGRYWRTLQLREQLRAGGRDAITGPAFAVTTSPIRGESTQYHRVEKRKSLAERPVTPARVDEYIQVLALDPFPDRQMVGSLEGLIRVCREANVTLILYEVPTPAIFRDRLPPGLYDNFIALVDAAARQGEVPFIRPNKLRLRLSDHHFREQSHMNNRGARAFTAVFGESVVARALKQKVEKEEREAARKKKEKKRKAAKKHAAA